MTVLFTGSQCHCFDIHFRNNTCTWGAMCLESIHTVIISWSLLVKCCKAPCIWNLSTLWSYLISANTLRARQNDQHFTDDIFKCISLNENAWIPIDISLKSVPEGSVNNIPTLVQIMAWCRSGSKPLSEPMMVSLLTHICVPRPQWINKMLYWLVDTQIQWSTNCLISILHNIIEYDTSS